MIQGERQGKSRIHITRAEFSRIEMHSYSELMLEVGGFLVGEIRDGYTSVVASIPALKANSQQISLTFTHEVWDEALKIVAVDYPDLSIVGWYHTHPSFGLFLSEYDTFIQKNFFSAQGQVALVVDPIAGNFAWFAVDGRSKEPKIVHQGTTETGPRTRAADRPANSSDTARLLLAIAAASVMSGLVTWSLTMMLAPEKSSSGNWKAVAERQSQELQRVNDIFNSQIFEYSLAASESIADVMTRFYGSPEIPDFVRSANGWADGEVPELAEGDQIYLVSVPGLFFPGVSEADLAEMMDPEEPAPSPTDSESSTPVPSPTSTDKGSDS